MVDGFVLSHNPLCFDLPEEVAALSSGVSGWDVVDGTYIGSNCFTEQPTAMPSPLPTLPPSPVPTPYPTAFCPPGEYLIGGGVGCVPW